MLYTVVYLYLSISVYLSTNIYSIMGYNQLPLPWFEIKFCHIDVSNNICLSMYQYVVYLYLSISVYLFIILESYGLRVPYDMKCNSAIYLYLSISVYLTFWDAVILLFHMIWIEVLTYISICLSIYQYLYNYGKLSTHTSIWYDENFFYVSQSIYICLSIYQ